MFSKNVLLLLFISINVVIVTNARNTFLDHVKNNTLVHHAETNTIWEYIGTYSQTDSTINYIAEVPVFQFLCDVLPVRMAYALKACIEYRNLLLKNSDVIRLKEIAEIHSKSRTKRQLLVGALAVSGTAYSAYRIVGDLLGPSNRNLAYRLEDVESFKEHQEALNNVTNTVIASLQNNQLTFIKAFKDVYDDANVTRQYLYQHIRQVIAFRNEYDSFAKHAIVQEMRNHYDKIIRSISKVEEHKLNLDFLSAEQRSITYDYVYQKVKTLLPENFGTSLSVFIQKLLVHQILSFTTVNESTIFYELSEKDFQFDISVDPKFEKQNQTVNLDEIIPKIIGHLRVENIFGVPRNFSENKNDLFKVTKLPYFVTSKMATRISNIPTYFTLSPDGYSSEWENHDNRRCSFDQQSKFMFCAIPIPVYSQIQNPCIRSIVFNTNSSECLKDEIDMFPPQSIRLAPNVFAISTDSKLQCLEKIENKENVWTNINKIGIIRTKCSGFISCGKFDFRSDDVCADANSYILLMRKSVVAYRLGESMAEADTDILLLKSSLNISAMSDEVNLYERLREEGFTEFKKHISRVIGSKWSFMIFFASILLSIGLPIVFYLLCKYYARRCIVNLLGCYQKKSLTVLSPRENQTRAILSETLLGTGGIARPPPVPPRNRPTSFLERLSIYSRVPKDILTSDYTQDNNSRAFEQFRTGKTAEKNDAGNNENIVSYDLPVVKKKTNDVQDTLYIPRVAYFARRSNSSLNQGKPLDLVDKTIMMNPSIATSGSFFEEDKYNLN